MSIGKSKAKVYVEKSTGVTFDDVAGIDEARAELMEIVDFLKRPAHYRRLGSKTPRGCCSSAPPGPAKHLLAKAVAGEAGVPFFSLSGADFVEMFVGVGARPACATSSHRRRRRPRVSSSSTQLDALGKARGIESHDGRPR